MQMTFFLKEICHCSIYSSVMLHSISWQLFPHVLQQPSTPIFMGQVVEEECQATGGSVTILGTMWVVPASWGDKRAYEA